MNKNRKRQILLTSVIIPSLTWTQVFASNCGQSYIAKWKGNARAALSITIDDNGPGDMRDIQASILEEYGVRGTFNIITGPLTSDPAKRQMFLDIFNRGHELGSHTVDHIHLANAGLETIMFELGESKLFIEGLTGAPCVSYAAPYNYLDLNVLNVANELYISARGNNIFINGATGGDLWNIGMAPYPFPWGSTWKDEEYITGLRQYVEDVFAVEGWAIEMWHNLTSDPNQLSTGQAATETVFRTHLAELTSEYNERLWIAPQGTVARYYLEREETSIKVQIVADQVILVDLVFNGDLEIFDEPLTVFTNIPKHWLDREITIVQDGTLLDYVIDMDDDLEPWLTYDALPTGDVISIAYKPIPGDLDKDGDVDMVDLSIFAAHWLEGAVR